MEKMKIEKDKFILNMLFILLVAAGCYIYNCLLQVFLE
jgi:hypothetical protein